MLFLSVRGFFDYAGPADHSRLSRSTVLPSPFRQKVGVLIHRLFEAQSPGPPIPLSTLRAPPHGVTRKTRGQDGFAVLLSCRALSSPTTCRFIPALDVMSLCRTSEFLSHRRVSIYGYAVLRPLRSGNTIGKQCATFGD